MPKKDIKSALSKSLGEERDKFAAADNFFGEEKKPKTIRDAFSFPENDYKLIAKLRERLLKKAVSASKSEVLRAGLIALDRMGDRELIELINSLTKLKTGRPKKK